MCQGLISPPLTHMPAVQLTKLKTQLADQCRLFERPLDFQRHLRDLFEFYSDRVYRPGQNIQSDRLHPAYHIPTLVSRQLNLELASRCQTRPEAALAIADTLWKDPYLEPRLLAAFILGQVTPNPSEPVTERITAWVDPQEEKQALITLLDMGCARLRIENQAAWIKMAQNWMDSPYPSWKVIAIHAMLPAIRDQRFENFPPLFHMTGPLLQATPNSILPEIQQLVESLARRNPRETAFFLRQILATPPRPALVRLVRKCLPAFPETSQEGLKAILKSIAT